MNIYRIISASLTFFIVLFFCAACNTVNKSEEGFTSTEYTIDEAKDTKTTYVDSETSEELIETETEKFFASTEYTIDEVKDTKNTYADSETPEELTETETEESKSNNDKEVGYLEYVNSFEYEYEACPFFGGWSEWCNSKKARTFYNNNSRRCGKYLITDFQDGVCINRYFGKIENHLKIPKVLEGKPVLKLDGYLMEEEDMAGEKIYSVVSAFANKGPFTLKIPSTLKYISADALYTMMGMTSGDDYKKIPYIMKINVDRNNTYYTSENGVLFSKDKKILLYNKTLEYEYFGNELIEYVVPDSVEIFQPLNFVYEGGDCLTFGKNIKHIDAYVVNEEGWELEEVDYIPNLIIKGYKGTVAEKWAEKYNLKFVPID